MSSILEALRELEGERPAAARREIPPPEPPRVARRTTGAVIPVLGGLAVGMVVFGVWALAPHLLPSSSQPASVDAPAVDAPEAESEPAPTVRPSWLDTAEAPRARVDKHSTAATPPPDAVPSASSTPPVAAAPRAREAQPPADAPPAAASDDTKSVPSGGPLVIESIAYGPNVVERTVTMRFHGRRVTLRQRESIDGLEVQLIMPNGIYVQRGSEVYLLPFTR